MSEPRPQPAFGPGGPVVLCYHAISAHWPCSLAVRPGELERQITWLLDRGMVGATFSDAIAEPDPHRFAITFDDAFLSVRERALPILSRLGVPATVFAPTAFMGRRQPLLWPGVDRWLRTSHAGELTGMDYADLRDLAARGWEIGSHTRTHPNLATVPEAQLWRELHDARLELGEALSRPCFSLAYPYGQADPRAVRWARQAGYRAAATLPGWFTQRSSDQLTVPRIGVYRIDTAWRFRLKLSPAARGLVGAREDRGPRGRP